MTLSYWEKNSWFTDIDFCIVGSGIVGLSCALQLKKSYPKSKVLILEKGILPQGASTKNAGFACFGSMSEILSDLNHHSQQEVFNLVDQRYKGLKLLRETLGDQNLNYQQHGGYEVFLDQDKSLFEKCESQLCHINELLQPIFNIDIFKVISDQFSFQKTLKNQILNSFEGQIDTGKMMKKLLEKVQSKGVVILNSVEVSDFISHSNSVTVKLNQFEFSSKHLFIATNAFSNKLLNLDIQPARNQVLITKPIKSLHIKGTFHLDEGYYYFRNINDRILLGGGRNLDIEGESTTKFETTQLIQSSLEQMLYKIILPKHEFKIDQRWSGILGVGKQKKPILKVVDNRVYCAVRLGGMGIAIGSQIGKNLAQFVE